MRAFCLSTILNQFLQLHSILVKVDARKYELFIFNKLINSFDILWHKLEIRKCHEGSNE